MKNSFEYNLDNLVKLFDTLSGRDLARVKAKIKYIKK